MCILVKILLQLIYIYEYDIKINERKNKKGK